MSFGNIVMPWAKHALGGRDLVRRAYDAAYRIGDLTFAAYSWNELITNFLTVGDPLSEVQSEAENGLAFAQRARFGLVVDLITAQVRLIRMLRGLTSQFGSFNGDGFDELHFERHLASNPVLGLPEFWYWARKIQARFLAGEYDSAVDASLNAHRLLWTSPSQFETAEFRFYGALSHAACWDSASKDKKQQHFDALAAHYRQLQIWAEHCPENFENRSALVGAEIARIEGRVIDAERLYEQAISSARANSFIHNEALANEVAARFYWLRGLEKIAYTYLQDALYGYLRWGATAKVRQLERSYPHLKERKALLAGSSGTIEASVEHLELATVIKISQAVSSEMVLENLVETLMRTAIEHAGAERGLLILWPEIHPQVEAEATIIRDEKQLFRKNTVRVPVLVGAALYEETGDEGVAFVLDLSEQKRVEQALRRSEAYLAEAQRLSQTGSWYWNVVTGAVVWSQEFFTIFGFDSHNTEASYELYLERVHPEDRRNVEEARWEAVAEKKDFEAEYRLLLPGGLIKYVRSIGHFSGSPHGDIEYIGAVMDITERKRAEQERDKLRRTQAELAHINRVSTMGELTASLAHEIKQPISAAKTDAQTCLRWLARDRSEIAEAHAAASRVIKDVARASEIIGRISLLFKKGGLRREEVNLNELIRGMIVLLRSEAAQYSISIHAELADDLPQILADRIQLQQVFMNLMLNAIEAMKDAGPQRRLMIKSRQDGNSLLVSISDTGLGLRQEQAAQIFNPFFTSKSQGTGMGLPISRSIIESHGGRLWAMSNFDSGATFQFTLPLEVTAYQIA